MGVGHGKIKVCSVARWISLTIDSHLLWGRGIDQWDLDMGRLSQPSLLASMQHHSWANSNWLKAYWHTWTFLFLPKHFSLPLPILHRFFHSESTQTWPNVPPLECRTAWVFKRSLLKQQRNIKGEMWKGKSNRRGDGEKRVERQKRRKGHFYLGERHLNKL